MVEPTRLFIGSSSNGEDAEIEAAYEYSLRRRTNHKLDIVWMRQTDDPTSFWHGFDTKRWSTPFSGFRWAIPEYCNFAGRAIYTDVDMINNRDIRDLWNTDLKGKPFAARRGTRFNGHEFCVMVIDCALARTGNRLVSGLLDVSRQKTLEDYHHRCIANYSGNNLAVEDLDPRWNCLDGEDRVLDEGVWQLHFTKMATQPWKPAWFTGVCEEHPRADVVLWYKQALQEAKDHGYNPQIPDGPKFKYNIIGR